ncbi:MAG TPA: hypothetical protein K8U88_01285 [Levilactobacillus hammesii]|uniref:Uncharacterized protein n=1 Tax=Levilactobacillus hammesii TaxID=267633 RepID=A0A921F156_9LACO|nr:hypothetical protein [Levilactobacillus hammesii]
MLNIKLIKKIAIASAVALGMFAFGGATQANASSPHFDSRKITYHIDSTSKNYKGIWQDAINEWNSKGVLKFKQASKKKAMLRMTTRKTLKDNTLWDAYAPEMWGNTYSRLTAKLNRSYMDNYSFTRKARVNAATDVIEVGLGLDLNSDKRSHMSDLNMPITAYDVAQLRKLYAHVK